MPRILLRRLLDAPDEPVLVQDGTLVFADVSGFTKLSERLARTGREGAERLVDAINACFSALLADAYALGGSLLKFGGDAILLWFEGDGHPARACASAVAMRQTLRSVGRVRTGSSEAVLRMSVGVHSGEYELFLVGGSNRELIIAGPAATAVVQMEAGASAGQILISRQTAAELPKASLGRELGPGLLLARAPLVSLAAPAERQARPADELVAACLSTEVRAHVLSQHVAPEHRTATVAFVQFGHLDGLVEAEGPAAAAAALDEFVRAAQAALDRYEVCFLASDIAADGGKLMLTAGAPRVVGDDEERMLLALRQIIDANTRLPVRIGVNRGQVFTGEIGPEYRRTYAVMGDTVNLAARVMAAAPWGSIYSTKGVLARSQTTFDTTDVPPFKVKGKSKPVEALEVGSARRAALPVARTARLPLVGRDQELQQLTDAIAGARAGRGSLVEIVGETGSGKSRLLTEARELASDMRFVHATCEAYTRDVPYIGWRDPLRQLLGLSWEDPDDVVIGRLRNELKSSQPELLPWLPLLAIVIDAEVRSTRAVDDLSDEHRTEKLHEIVLQFLEPALEVPTLVQIEHAHLMDDASGALLHALSGRLESSGWIVIVTRRDVETGFVARDGAVKLDLGPMSREDAMALAEATPEAQQLPPHVLELAVERSGGSPEFLIDLLAAAVDGSGTLPDSVDSAASARIDALDPGDRALVRRVSVLGLSFHAERVRDVIEPAAPEPDEATWERLAGVFAVDPDGHVRFKRPALRDVAYHSLPFKLRRELHAAVGTSLERDQGRDVDADPAVLSLHFILAGDHERAWRYALEGAKRAEVRFAHADAARLYRRAIEAGRHYGAQVAELAGVWESLGVALHKTGELSEATHAIATARRVSAGDPIAQGRLFYRHARIAEHSARLATAVRWAFRGLRALEGLRERDAVVWRAKTLGRLVFYRTRQGRMREAERLCHRAIAESQVAGELDARAYAYYMLDWALSEQGRREEARYSARALEIYVRLGDLEQQANVLNNLAAFAFYEWRWDEALELFRQSADCSRRAGIHNGVATAAVNIGDLLTDRGLYQEAASHLTRARRLWSATGERAGTAHATGLLGRLAVRQGRHREGLDLLHQAVEELRSLGEYGYVEFAEALLAEAETFGGDPGRALAIADRLIGAADRNLPLLYRIRATALAQLGRDGASEALATSLAAARERDALYDIAAALKLADSLLGPDSASARERDAILDRLGVQLLPAPPLATFTQYETSSAAVG